MHGCIQALIDIGGTPVKHPPYSPDLDPCDSFWAFSTFKHSYKARNIALTLKRNKPSSLTYTIRLEMAYCTRLRRVWDVAKNAQHSEGMTLKNKLSKTQEFSVT